jgi:hypothetical protein
MKRTTINVKVDPFPYPFDINVTPPLEKVIWYSKNTISNSYYMNEAPTMIRSMNNTTINTKLLPL